METMDELTAYVCEKATNYLLETGEKGKLFPMSIVDFVIENVCQNCHFPSHFTEQQVVLELSKGKNTLAMACVEVYAKVGAEGQNSHSENSISRGYDSSWISPKLYDSFPNYVTVL